MKRFLFLCLLTSSYTSFSAVLTLEKNIDEEMVIIFYTHTGLVKSSIKVEMPKGYQQHVVNTWFDTLTGADFLIGDHSQGRKPYKAKPDIKTQSRFNISGALRFFRNVKGEIGFESKFGSKAVEGILLRH